MMERAVADGNLGAAGGRESLRGEAAGAIGNRGLFVAAGGAAAGFGFAAAAFVFDHAAFDAWWFRALAAAFAFAFGAPGGGGGAGAGFEGGAEAFHGDGTVLGLAAFLLAADFQAGGAVDQPHGGRGFVDFLTAGTGTSEERFLDVVRVDAQAAQPGFDGVEIWLRHD